MDLSFHHLSFFSKLIKKEYSEVQMSEIILTGTD